MADNSNPNQVLDGRIYYLSGGTLHSEGVEEEGIEVHTVDEIKNKVDDFSELNDAFVEDLREAFPDENF